MHLVIPLKEIELTDNSNRLKKVIKNDSPRRNVPYDEDLDCFVYNGRDIPVYIISEGLNLSEKDIPTIDASSSLIVTESEVKSPRRDPQAVVIKGLSRIEEIDGVRHAIILKTPEEGEIIDDDAHLLFLILDKDQSITPEAEDAIRTFLAVEHPVV